MAPRNTIGCPSKRNEYGSFPVSARQDLHHDHLGSLVAVSNASGGEVASLRYWPFGGLRTLVYGTGYNAVPTDRLFTGQIRDLGDDRFSFFKARYYDATIGKFHTPDTVAPDPNYPLRLNHYAYADNNPLKLRDSTGHYSEIPDGMVTPSILITTRDDKDLISTIFKADGGGHILFRPMRGTPEGKPELGASSNSLGIRPGVDITPDEHGNVGPGQHGLSVTPDDISKLPEARLPREFGGKGKFPVWALKEGDLAPDLKYTPDEGKPDEHGFITPSYNMAMEDYLRAIDKTQDDWTKVSP